MNGSTYQRCYCRDAAGKQLGKRCPKLTQRTHGSWALRQELPPQVIDGKERRDSFNRSGYGTKRAARADLDQVRALLAVPDSDDAEALGQLSALLKQVSSPGFCGG